MSGVEVDKLAVPGQGAQPQRRQSREDGRRRPDGIRTFDRRINDVISLGSFRLDDRIKKVYVEGKAKCLSPKLFELLKIFALNPGRIFSLAELAVNLWPDNDRRDPEDVSQYIYLLRKAIEVEPARPRWLRNVRGFGYQLMIDDDRSEPLAPGRSVNNRQGGPALRAPVSDGP